METRAVTRAHPDARVKPLSPAKREAELRFRQAARHLERGDAAAAARVAQAAWKLDPSLRTFGALATYLDSLDPAGAYAAASALVAGGFGCSVMLHRLAVAATNAGRGPAEVRRLNDFDRFVRVWTLHPPDHADLMPLRAELADRLKYFGEPAGRAIRAGWRRGGLNEQGDLPLVRRLLAQFRGVVDEYMSTLADDPTHPFVAARPAHYALKGWSVVSGRDTHHASHLHPSSWVNGVYYVSVPPAASRADSHAGWLRIGPPPESGLTPALGWDERWVRPQPGTLVLMPSHFHHETEPIGADVADEARRVCLVFEATATD
jgi:hypothetical protein